MKMLPPIKTPRSCCLLGAALVLLGLFGVLAPAAMAAEGGITADLPYILQRWLQEPQGLSFGFAIYGQERQIGSGEFSVQGLRWFQAMPQGNAMGKSFWVYTLMTKTATYVWSSQLGRGVVLPLCPAQFLLGEILAVVPGGRDIYEAQGGIWQEWFDNGEGPSEVRVSIHDDPVVPAAVWRYSWPFTHDPDIEQALVVTVSYPGQGMERRIPDTPLWNERLHSLVWFFDDQETRTYNNWEMASGVKPSLLEVPGDIEWEEWVQCPYPDSAPLWWEWGLD